MYCHPYLLWKSNRPKQIKDRLEPLYGDSLPLFSAVALWAAELKRGCASLGDGQHSGRAATATMDEKVTQVHPMVLDDR